MLWHAPLPRFTFLSPITLPFFSHSPPSIQVPLLLFLHPFLGFSPSPPTPSPFHSSCSSLPLPVSPPSSSQWELRGVSRDEGYGNGRGGVGWESRPSQYHVLLWSHKTTSQSAYLSLSATKLKQHPEAQPPLLEHQAPVFVAWNMGRPWIRGAAATAPVVLAWRRQGEGCEE